MSISNQRNVKLDVINDVHKVSINIQMSRKSNQNVKYQGVMNHFYPTGDAS